MSNEIIDGIIKAFELIFSGDPTVIDITSRTILISFGATALCMLWSLPTAIVLSQKRFRGKIFIKGMFNALLGIPTTALGLILFLLLSKSGPLGFLHILYTPTAIIFGQAVLITPIAVSLVTNAIEAIDPEIRNLAKTLGASELEASLTVLGESTSGVGLAVIASFNRAIAELGVALMVGGNISGYTRVLTTTIALDTNKGEIVLSIALTIILLLIVTGLSLVVNLAQRGKT
ncbi:MAG TPA: ABC transporter permease [Candidatus Bathyarchaeia archaeon]|nr:ABC transporter permease [Candidatus Bathyarchaeia archaeon]